MALNLSSVVDQPSSEGAIAQLGERLLCKQEVVGSIPSGSTRRLSGGSAPPRLSAPAGLWRRRLSGRLPAKKLVRENRDPSALDSRRRALVLSDIVKRRSIRAPRVT